MPILADCHLHSCFSGDSDAPMEAMIQRAISLGLSHMCFTEHMDLDFPQTPESPAGMFELRTDDYRAALMECRKRYEGQILRRGAGHAAPHQRRECALRQRLRF